jgi:uncharacterized protein (TIGR03435 family)
MQKVAGVILLTSLAAFAQPAERPAFEVASVRPGQPGKEAIDHVPGSLTMRNVRLTAAIAWAYDAQDYQVSGPAWINDTRFDIAAKAGSPAPPAELRKMLQTLLAERFQLTLHRQPKDLAALVLTVGKNGHKLQAVEEEGSPSFQTGKMSLTGKGATLNQLTAFLSRELRIPVIDQTGLAGRFNYFLDIGSYVTEEMRRSGSPDGGPPPDAPGIVAQAIQAQLGLKMDSKKAPVEMLVVDRVEKPTEN